MDEPAAVDSVEAIGVLLSEAEKVSHELARLADTMVTQAESASRDARRLIAALAEATAVLATEETVKPAPSPAASDGARMLARQMLAGGSDRASVEEQLRTSFGVRDAAAVVDSLVAPHGA
jgi:hypothetical protein